MSEVIGIVIISKSVDREMAKITELDMSKLEELKAKAKSGKITDEERREMMALMDEELEQFMLSGLVTRISILLAFSLMYSCKKVFVTNTPNQGLLQLV